MSEFIEEYRNIFTSGFCDDLIEQIQEYPQQTEVPKNDDIFWKKIEHHLYLNILLCIANYKKKRIKNMALEADNPISKEILDGFNYKLKIDSFKIIQNTQKVEHYKRSVSRYNLMTFVIYLNHVEFEHGRLIFKDKIIEPEAGKLVLFPETPELPYCGESPPVGVIQYIITGQISLIE